MSRYKRYEGYKDSGVEWIGEIPEHWGIIKLKFLSTIFKGKNPQELTDEWREEFLPYLSMEYLRNSGDTLTLYAYPEKNLVTVNNSDILILWDGSNAGEIVEGKNGILSSTMAKIVPNNIVTRYLYWFLKGIEKFFKDNTVGMGIPHVNGETLKNHLVLLPNLQDQNSIANFLDQKTAEIDGLIADKEKLIELLQEKRQAIITEAVTKGLNPNVRMKDSGSEWIGEIPEHWSIIKMKYLLSSKKYSIKAGPFGSQLKNDDMVSGDIKVYNQKTVLDNDFKSGDYYIENCKYEELRAFEVFSGDLLVTTRGTIGKTAIVPKDAEKGILHPCLIKITLNPDKVLNDYVNVIFNNTKIVTNQIMLESNATTIDVIYTDTLKNLVLPIPPLEEQKSIIDFVDAKIGEIDGLISSINSQIQKLKEYRQSLISEAVTGKIDVRVFENKDEVIYSEQDSSPCRELTHVAE